MVDTSSGGIDAFKAQFVEAGAGMFGSGWIWLVVDGKRLEIVMTTNAECPLTQGKHPLSLRRLGACLLPRLPEPSRRLPSGGYRQVGQLALRR